MTVQIHGREVFNDSDINNPDIDEGTADDIAIGGTTPAAGAFTTLEAALIKMKKGADLASADPLVIGTDGDYFDVTGTTGFASMTVAADRHFFTQFDAVLTMTHHATNLDLPGEANITTAAGDMAEWISTGVNTVQCVNYSPAVGSARAGANADITSMTNLDDDGIPVAKIAGATKESDLIPPAAVAFAGSTGYTITHNRGHTNYQLVVNPVADPVGFLGEIWISKANNTAVVYNSGTASGNFDYVIIPSA